VVGRGELVDMQLRRAAMPVGERDTQLLQRHILPLLVCFVVVST
jgi:hypothetical protein